MIRCKDCMYFRNFMANEVGLGKCIISPPFASDVKTGGSWPFVYYDQSCGQFISRYDKTDYQQNFKSEGNNERSE